jgi:hypothetical protein
MSKRKVRKDKIKLTTKDLNQIETMAGLGFTQIQICNVLGISVDTLKRRLKEGDKELSAVISKGKVNALSKIAKKAYTLAISGNTSMIKYFLSCQGGWSEKEQISEPEKEELNDQVNYTMDEILDALHDNEFEEFLKLHKKLGEFKNIAIKRIEDGAQPKFFNSH